MIAIKVSPKSCATIVLFDTIEQAASLTLPSIKKGAIALSGGSTFAALFTYWALASRDNFAHCQFFPVDERVVPFEDPNSNWGAAYASFLGPIGRAVDRKNHAQSKASYETLLRTKFPETAIPIFDTILLGVGDDGHTASLFPGGTYLENCDDIVLETVSPKPPLHRISLGPSVIAAAHSTITIVAGTGKKEIAQRIIAADHTLPIVSVLSKRSDSIIFMERALYP